MCYDDMAYVLKDIDTTIGSIVYAIRKHIMIIYGEALQDNLWSDSPVETIGWAEKTHMR